MYDELTGNLRAQATHFSVHDETSLLLLKAADAIEDLDSRLNLHRQGKIRRWIPVTERLPEEAGNYLTFSVGGTWGQLSAVEISFWDCKNFHVNSFTVVTHWMPLPEPPKADKDGAE